jgi:hypothetical protein
MYQGWAVTVERLKELWPAKVPALVMRGEHDFVFKVFWPLLDQQFYGDLDAPRVFVLVRALAKDCC